MGLNYASPLLTAKIAKEIEGSENVERRTQSLKQFEVYMDRMEDYVRTYLRTFYNEKDVEGLPVISSINLARRIVKQEASIYKCPPTRTFEGCSEEQVKVLEQVYKDMSLDAMLQKSNEYFKLQAQNNIQIIPHEGVLKIRVLLNHHFDVVPKPANQEQADAYILSGFDKLMQIPGPDQWRSDGTDETIADVDDWKSGDKIFVLWSDDFNFLFNDRGQALGGYTPNPIGICPFVDISPAKDFEFFIRQGSSVTDFTVQFNAALTDMSQIMRMQGFAQAFLIAGKDEMPVSMKVGPSICVKLTQAEGSSVTPQFGFAQPNADLAGSLSYLESLVALFLSSRGLDPKSISGSGEGTRYTSGMERLLSMIEKFEATRSDFNVYEKAEHKIFKIVKAYLNTYAGTDILKYKISPLSEDAEISIKFEEPEMIETEMDKITLYKEKLELGIMSKLEAIMEDRDITEEEAQKIKDKIDEETQMDMPEVPAVDAVTGQPLATGNFPQLK